MSVFCLWNYTIVLQNDTNGENSVKILLLTTAYKYAVFSILKIPLKKKLNMHLPYDTAIPCLGIYPTTMQACVYTKMYT